MYVYLYYQAEAEEALAAALPALEEARIALSDLEKSDVTEIRLTHVQCIYSPGVQVIVPRRLYRHYCLLTVDLFVV